VPVTVDGELALWSGVDGEHIKQATGTGLVKATAGVYSVVGESINDRSETEARTATAAPGGSTGVISDGTDFVVVTVDDANKVITLPTPTPGQVVAISNGATGYELRSSDPATVAINGGTAANAESAIPANTLVICVCRTATAWLCTNTTTAGVASATEVAA
jgi:hypothetical protein